MKKMFAAALIAALVAPLFAFSAEVTGKVNVQKLNLRTGAGLKSPVAGRIANGTEVKILRLEGNWAEIPAPASLPVYVSEARINPDGKTNGEVNVRSAMSTSAPCLMTLAKDVAVTRIDERANGWVRIVPPAELKLYAAAVCLDFDRNLFDAEGKIIERKPEAPKAPETVQPAAPAPAAASADTVKKTAAVSAEGYLVEWKYSDKPTTKYALLDAPTGKNKTFLAFDKAPQADLLNKKVSVTGTAVENGGATPCMLVQKIVEVKEETK